MGLSLHQLGAGERHIGLIARRIDREEKIALGDLGAFFEFARQENAADPRPDFHLAGRGDAPRIFVDHRQIARGERGDLHLRWRRRARPLSKCGLRGKTESEAGGGPQNRTKYLH